MRKYLAIVIMLFATIMLVGCARVDYTRVYTGSGAIIDEIDILLDSSEFSSGTAQSVYNVVKKDVDLYNEAIDNWAKTTFTEYVDEVSLYEVFSKGIKAEISQMQTVSNGYAFTVFITFSELYHFIYFYGLNTPEILQKHGIIDIEGAVGFATEDYGPFLQEYLKNNYSVDESPIFTNKYVWSTDNVLNQFSRLTRTTDQTYLEYYIARINSLLDTTYTEEEILDNVDINQHFQTTQTRIKGDTEYFDGLSQPGFVIYSWNLNSDGGQSIDIYRLLPVTTWWYVLGVCIALVCVIIMFIAFRIKKNGEKRSEQ